MKNKFFKIILGFLLLFVISCKANITSDPMDAKDFDSRLLNRTFYMDLGGHYSYKNISFYNKNGHVYYSESFYYPKHVIRTISYYGVVNYYKNKTAALFPLKKAENLNVGKRKTKLSPFECQGIFNIKEDSKRDYLYRIKYEDKDHIKVQGDLYSDYKKDMIKAINEKDSEKFLKLYQFHVLNHQSKVKHFGQLTSESSGNHDGYYSGNFGLKLYLIGKLGIKTNLNNYSDFYGIKLKGSLFGGTHAMSNTTNIYIDDKKSASVNYDHIKVSRGVASGGYYKVTLDSQDYDVKYDVLSD